MTASLNKFVSLLACCLIWVIQAPGQLPALDTALAPFYHGVASGDPARDRVVLWTRVTPPSGGQVQVAWRMATDTAFTNVVKSGNAVAKPYFDYTVLVTVNGLKKDTWYYYQFEALGKYSLTGRTKTLPHGMVTDSVRMAVVSCSNFQAGFFNAYEALAVRNDVDVVVHLGDYIYEYDTINSSYNPALNRAHDPSTEAIDKAGYWARYSQYRLDPQLRFMHQQYPVISIWDDHEVANNAYQDGAENHNPATEGNWYERITAARQAYARWLPVKKPDQDGDSSRLHRKFDFGKLLRLSILDTRLHGRTIQLDPADPNFNDTNRTMLGMEQRAWLFKKINSSQAKWNLLGQQVMVAPMTVFGAILNNDQWDGYPAEKEWLIDNLQLHSAKNFVVLTGDIHSAWGNDLPLPGYSIFNRSASAGVEFVTPSVTAPNPYSSLSSGLVQLFNSHVRYVDLAYKGFQIIDANHSRVQCDWYSVSSTASTVYTTGHEAGWYVNDGEKFLREASGPSARHASKQAPFAPAAPMAPTPRFAAEAAPPLVVLGAYPNPLGDRLFLHFHLIAPGDVLISLTDLAGKECLNAVLPSMKEGLHLENFSTSSLAGGTYVLSVSSGSYAWKQKLIRK